MMMSADSIDLLLLSRERERRASATIANTRESGGTMMAMTFSRFNDIAKTTSVLMVKSDGMNVCVCVFITVMSDLASYYTRICISTDENHIVAGVVELLSFFRRSR